MKKIILIIVLFSGYLFAQSWNSIVTTTINEPNLVKLENLTNKDGIHIVVQNSNSSNSIKYYKLNSSGTVQATTTIESQGGAEFPSIAGDNDHLYISYRLGNNIVTKKYIYSNGTWETQTSIPLNNHECDGVDNNYDWRGLHLVYSESNETHYWLYASTLPTKHKVVSDQSLYVGNTPTITISSSKAHIGFNSSGYAKTRDKNLITESWENTQAVVSGSAFEKVYNGCDNLFDYYHVYVPGVIVELYVKERDIDGTSWSSAFQLNGSVHPYPDGMITATVTNDGKTHILYDAEQLIHRSYNCSTSLWSDEYEVTSYPGLTTSSSLSSTSNDLYVVYRVYAGGSTYLKYRQYDAAPLTPTNFTGLFYNNHPKLIWNLNNEPDIDGYEIYRLITGGSGVYELLTTVSSGTLSYVDNGVQLGGRSMGKVFYKIRAKDNYPNYSAYTNEIIYSYSGLNKTSFVNNSVEYKLFSNYPNPFNPSTQIRYSLAQDAEVTLRVYDMLGTEVAELINETQTAGSYEINLSSEGLSSGVYIYRLTAANNGRILFTDSKQMILLR